MPMFMLNGKQYGGNGGNYQVAKMSKADYDALTDAQKNDGTLRIVVDSAGNSVNYMSAQVAGAKTDDTHTNLLNPTLETTTINGITCTNNGDGTFTLNGTATSNTFFHVVPLIKLEVGKKYKLCGCPSGGADQVFKLAIYRKSTSVQARMDTGNGAEFTPDEIEHDVSIVIYKNQTVSNLVFKPMLTTDLSATYDDFVGYTGGTGRLNSDVAAHQKEISRINSDLSDSGWVKFDNTHNAYYRKVGKVVTIKCEGNITAIGDLVLTQLPFSIPNFEIGLSLNHKTFAFCNNGTTIHIGNSDSASHNFIFCYTTFLN